MGAAPQGRRCRRGPPAVATLCGLQPAVRHCHHGGCSSACLQCPAGSQPAATGRWGMRYMALTRCRNGPGSIVCENRGCGRADSKLAGLAPPPAARQPPISGWASQPRGIPQQGSRAAARQASPALSRAAHNPQQVRHAPQWSVALSRFGIDRRWARCRPLRARGCLGVPLRRSVGRIASTARTRGQDGGCGCVRVGGATSHWGQRGGLAIAPYIKEQCACGTRCRVHGKIYPKISPLVHLHAHGAVVSGGKRAPPC